MTLGIEGLVGREDLTQFLSWVGSRSRVIASWTLVIEVNFPNPGSAPGKDLRSRLSSVD